MSPFEVVHHVGVPNEILERSMLSEAQKLDYDSMPKHDQEAVTVYKHSDGQLYALHSRFVSVKGIATFVRFLQRIYGRNCFLSSLLTVLLRSSPSFGPSREHFLFRETS